MLGPFNRLPFNRVATVEIFGGFGISLSGDVEIAANIVTISGFEIECNIDIIIEAIREQFGAFVVEQAAEIEVSANRERTGRFTVECALDLSITAGKTHVDIVEFIGEFNPGDQIEIDSGNLKMTLNGQNALHLMRGDFFDLNTGNNELIYSDDATGRAVRKRITYKDKYV